jgi:hypothetical protein
MKKLIVLLILAVFIGTGCAIKTGNSSTNTSVGASTNTFGSDDQNIFRYQQLITSTDDTIGSQEYWSYQKNHRADFSALIKNRTIDYSSSLVLADEKLQCGYGMNQNNPDSEFSVTRQPHCNQSTLSFDGHDIDQYMNDLGDTLTGFGEQISTSDETFHGYAATRSSYKLSTDGKDLNVPKEVSGEVIAELLALKDLQQTVEVSYKEASTGHVLFRAIIAQDHTITDMTPEKFFSENHWKEEMTTSEKRLSDFRQGALTYALPPNGTGTIEERNGEKRFVSSVYPFSFTISEDEWQIDIAERKIGSAQVMIMIRPDPVEGVRESEVGFPNQGYFIAQIYTKGERAFDESLTLLNEETEKDAVGDPNFPITTVLTAEEDITIAGLQGKRYTYTSTNKDKTITEFTIQTLLQIDENTILDLRGSYGNGSDSEQLRTDILTIENSLTIE